MTDAICSVPECAKPVKRTSYCYGHYMKSWRYGTPTPEFPARWEDLRGARFGLLEVVERHGQAWLCRCDCGATSTVRAGDLNRGSIFTCGDSAKHHRKGDAGYTAAHDRVRRKYGSARSHPCVDCGSPARHWSYNHDDPDELVSIAPRTLGVAYSLSEEHYSPRCVPCHKRFDLDRINAADVA